MFDWGMHSWYGFGQFPAFLGLAAPFIIIALILKGLVLWLAARRGHTGWFIFFLIINTVGIGELIYLIMTNGFQELRKEK